MVISSIKKRGGEKMNNKLIITVIVVLVLVAGGLFVANQNSKQTDLAKAPQEYGALMQKEPVAKEKEESEEGEGAETPEQKAIEKKEGEALLANEGNKAIKSNSPRYVEYSKAALDESSDKRRVLYFYATWCPTCKVANEDFTKNPGKIPEDVVVIRTNYNDPNTDQEEKDLAKKYGITYQHTFVQIDSQGKEVTKWNGGQTNELLVNIK